MNSLSLVVLFAIGIFSVSAMSFSDIAYADVIAPLHQMEMNFSANEVICKENLVKIIRTSNGDAACVSPDAVENLIKRDFALPVDPNAILEAEEKPKEIGKITHMATTKHYTNPGEIVTSSKITPHNYVFKVCAFDEKIKSPEIIITSDTETKSIKMRDIRADSCNTNAVKIRAMNADSITSKLLNQGGISEAIAELEASVETLKSKITEQREKLTSINAESPSNERAKKVSAIHKHITDLRNELKDTRAQLQKYLLFLNLSTNSELTPVVKGKSITGVDVDDALADIISVNEALIQPETKPENSMAYNVVFEICTADTTLRIPIVELSSDVDSKIVKMAEKVVTNSCQVTTGKINAVDANSIEITLSGQTQSSISVVSLEQKIDSIKDEMKVEQEKLNSVSVSSSITKEERAISISESTLKLQELRKELITTKAELHKILLEVYR